MPNTSNRILVACLIIVVAACLCLSVIGLGTAGYMLLKPASRSIQPAPAASQSQGINSPTPEPSATTGPQAQGAVSPTPGSNQPTAQPGTISPSQPSFTSSTTATATYAPVSPDIARQMDQIQQQVSQITGLQAREPVTQVLISPAQLAQRVESDFAKQNDPKANLATEQELIAWGLIKPDFDFNNYMERLQIEEIAGFYDNKSKEMFVVAGQGFGGYEKFTYSHEFTHALQDQNFDIEHGLNYNDQACKNETERCAAVQALLEGDAVLSQYNWLSTYASTQDKLDIQQFANNLSLPLYDQAPDFLKQDFDFPYSQGLDFVQSLFTNGGWQAVDNAFKNPPVSTAQILHPQLYPDQKPVSVTLPALSSPLGSDWSELEQNTVGEWYTYLILAHGIDSRFRLNDATAKAAAQGWAGDSYVTYYNEKTKGIIIVLETIWVSNSDAQQFASAFQNYSKARFGNPIDTANGAYTWSSNGAYTEFYISGDKTTWIYAPDANTAKMITQTMQIP